MNKQNGIKKNKPKKLKQKRTVIKMSQLFKESWLDISAFWKTLFGIIAVYAGISLLFIIRISLFPSEESLRANIELLVGEGGNGRVSDSLTVIGTSVLDVTTPSNSLLQLLIFILASTAFVWALRKQRGLKKISIKQAFYDGPSNIVAIVLSLFLLLLTLIPASLASSLLYFGLPIAGGGLEKIMLYVIGGGLTALSLFWLLVWWPVIYIVMIPGTRPIKSMRAAAALTKGCRTKTALRILGILSSVLVLCFITVVPLSLLWNRITPFIVFAMTFISFGLLHTLLFNLYRSLVHDATASEPATKPKKTTK